jgi:hypothetical protein
MNDLDSTDFARDVLVRLAATVPDNPGRVTSVRRLVRRRHRRRTATMATIGVAGLAGAGALLVAGSAKRPEPLSPASVPTAPAETKPTEVSTPTPADPCRAKVAAAESAASGTIPSEEGRFKATGTITAVVGDVITVDLEAASNSLTHVTATIAPNAEYLDAGEAVAARPHLAAGDRVTVGGIARAGGTYSIDLVETHPATASSKDAAGRGVKSPSTTDPESTLAACPPAG